MKTRHLAKLVLLSAIASIAPAGYAQAVPTASQALQLSAFGGVTGTYTGFEGGKNLGLTLGADLTFLSVPRVKPSFEIRGTAPIDSGHVDSQLNFLLGPKVEYRLGRFHPYGDVFFGRGQITYQQGGIVYNGLRYLKTPSTIYSLGAGLDYEITPRWGAKVDYQFQHWNTPFPSFNPIHPKATTFGVIYKFNFAPHYHRSKSH